MNLFSQLGRVNIFRKHIIWNTRQTERCIQTGQRSFKQVLTKTLRIRHEDYYKQIDKVPEDYEMIYKSPLHYSLNIGKIAAVSTTVLLPFGWIRYYFTETKEAVNFVGAYAADYSDSFIIAGILITLNIIVYLICHSTALRLYRNQKSYIAVMPGIIPRQNIQFIFAKGQAMEDFNGYSPLKYIHYKINGKSMLLVPERFRKPADLYDMLHGSDSKKYIK